VDDDQDGFELIHDVEYVEPIESQKLNYKCKENPPGSGNFKCDDVEYGSMKPVKKSYTSEKKDNLGQRRG